MEYIKELSADSTDSAGKLVPEAGESKAAVRRRLGDAMRFLGVNLEIKTDSDAVYFWIKPRRGREARRTVCLVQKGCPPTLFWSGYALDH